MLYFANEAYRYKLDIIPPDKVIELVNEFLDIHNTEFKPLVAGLKKQGKTVATTSAHRTKMNKWDKRLTTMYLAYQKLIKNRIYLSLYAIFYFDT